MKLQPLLLSSLAAAPLLARQAGAAEAASHIGKPPATSGGVSGGRDVDRIAAELTLSPAARAAADNLALADGSAAESSGAASATLVQSTKERENAVDAETPATEAADEAEATEAAVATGEPEATDKTEATDETGQPSDLTEEEQEQVEELKERDREVRAHEQAHAAAAGPYARGGPTFEYQKGPDGQRYAVGGEVSIDTSPIPGDPQATISKARVVQAAALSPADPSSQDRRVAAAASQMEAEARRQLREKQQGEGAGEASPKLGANLDVAA